MHCQNIEFQDTTYTIYIGENAKENWELIDQASQNDLWFHLDNLPSPHVILCVENKKIPKQIIKECALLCQSNSKYSNLKKISVIYTEIKHVSKDKQVGSVIATNTKKIII